MTVIHAKTVIDAHLFKSNDFWFQNVLKNFVVIKKIKLYLISDALHIKYIVISMG